MGPALNPRAALGEIGNIAANKEPLKKVSFVTGVQNDQLMPFSYVMHSHVCFARIDGISICGCFVVTENENPEKFETPVTNSDIMHINNIWQWSRKTLP